MLGKCKHVVFEVSECASNADKILMKLEMNSFITWAVQHAWTESDILEHSAPEGQSPKTGGVRNRRLRLFEII